MAKPGPKSGGDKKAEQEKAKKETLWFHAGQGNDKAKDAIKNDSKGGKK